MTYRIAVAGVLTAGLLLGGCASKAPAAEAAPAEATPVEAPKPQPKVLQRPAPSAQEIETPLKSGESLPIIAQGSTPVGEGAPPRDTPPTVPPAQPGSGPVEEVIEMPTRDLHGAFPGVGTSAKPNGNGKAAEATNQRIAEIEKQLLSLKDAATKAQAPAPGPDPAAIAAVQARLDELSTKVSAVQTEQQALAARPEQKFSGVEPARVDALEQQLEELKGAVETREAASASAVDRAKAQRALEERIEGLAGQIEGLEKSIAKAESGKKAPSSGVSTDELASRLQAVQEQMTALQEKAATATKDTTIDQRFEALSAKVAALEGAQTSTTAPAAPINTGVAPERVDALEEQLAALRQEMANAPAKPTKAGGSNDKAVEDRLQKLANQVYALEQAVDKAPKNAPADGVPSDELLHRLQAMQEQLDALQARPVAAAAPVDAQANAALQNRIEELTGKIDAIQKEQAARASQPTAAVPEERFTKIEQQISGIEAALQSAKPAEPATAAMDQRFTALESQLDGLRGELERQSKQLAAGKGAATVDGHVHSNVRRDMGDYRLGAGDKVEFQSFNDEKLSRQELVVRFDGHLSLPLIQDVAVGNLTRAEAEERIREEYRSIFRDPQLSLIVREAASKSFAIVGDIEKPGVYPYQTDTNLIQAISLAGGLRRRSSSSSVGGFVGVTGQLTKAFIVRTVNGEREVMQFDLRSLGKAGMHDSEAPVYWGDLIYVPEGVNLVYLLGESRNPVIVELTEGMKLLQLLALSGGFDASTAKLNGVVLMRQVNEDDTQILKLNVKEILRTGKDVPLVPGDIVYIPRKRLVRLQEFVSRFTGSISPILDLYTSAVDAYYAKDLQKSLIDDGGGNATLEYLNNLEDFGQSTSNIVDLFRSPR